MMTVSSPSPGSGSIEPAQEGSIAILAQNLNGPEGPKELNDGSILVCEMVGVNYFALPRPAVFTLRPDIGHGNKRRGDRSRHRRICFSNTGGLDFAHEDGRWVL